jgi:E1-E2 ATPase/Cation transport ATPase (P-type)
MLLQRDLRTGPNGLSDRAAARRLEVVGPNLAQRAAVRRGGVATSELVPGDVLLIEEGERIPADARLLRGAVEVDASALNGESVPVERSAESIDTADRRLDSPVLVVQWYVVRRRLAGGRGARHRPAHRDRADRGPVGVGRAGGQSTGAPGPPGGVAHRRRRGRRRRGFPAAGPTGRSHLNRGVPVRDRSARRECAGGLAAHDHAGTGDPTELALLAHADRLGVALPPARRDGERLQLFAFDPVRRRMGTADQLDGQVFVHVKGAPEEVLRAAPGWTTRTARPRWPW